MKNFVLILLLLLSVHESRAQSVHLQIQGASNEETATIDSLKYQNRFDNIKQLSEELSVFKDKLDRAGYLQHELLQNEKVNDSTHRYQFSLNNRSERLHIYIGQNPEQKQQFFPNEPDTISLAFDATEAYLSRLLQSLEQKGYSLAKLQLVNFRKTGQSLIADLKLDPGTRRELNDIVIQGYDKFPEGHKRNIKRLYKNRTFNQETLKQLYSDFNKFRFVSQTKYPEILFSPDTTKVYVYLEKAKPNRFDGLIGFANDEENQKLSFNGYLDLFLVNFVNAGEEFSLFWKSDGKEQRTFNAAIEVPYLFKSRFGIKASLNIFKQDSTFQNTRTAIDIGYYFNYNTKLFVGYQATESSDIQNQNAFSLNDYKNQFATAQLIYLAFKEDEFLFPEKTRVSAKVGYGSRTSNLQQNPQFFAEVLASHNFYLNEKNIVHLKTQNYILSSNEYIINELYRFGGINSIRGFNENSLQANQFVSLMSEYRYVAAPNLYVHSIIDYGYFNDSTSQNSDSLLGLGIGFGLLTKTGLLNLVYANGSTSSQEIKLSNSIVHLSLRANF